MYVEMICRWEYIVTLSENTSSSVNTVVVDMPAGVAVIITVSTDNEVNSDLDILFAKKILYIDITNTTIVSFTYM